jgi:hypothetical protein
LVQRCLIVGAGGSGKTTIARRLAPFVDGPVVDLDDLFWNPGWVPSTPDALRRRVAAATGGAGWIVAGNYTTTLRDVLWPRADTVVWLDLPRRVTFWRLVRRTIGDTLMRRELWPGCRQTPLVPFRTHLFSASWAQTAKYRVRYQEFLARPDVAHVQVRRFARQRDLDRWIDALRPEQSLRPPGAT